MSIFTDRITVMFYEGAFLSVMWSLAELSYHRAFIDKRNALNICIKGKTVQLLTEMKPMFNQDFTCEILLRKSENTEISSSAFKKCAKEGNTPLI